MQDRNAVRVSVVPPDFISLLCSGAWFHNSCKQRYEDYYGVFDLFLVFHLAPLQTSSLLQ